MFWFILLLAFILRLIASNQSFWLDEADNVVAAQSLDFISFLGKYPIGDFHPPGYFALLWLWSHVFGFGEITVRLLSVFLGLGTIVIIYLIGKDLFNKKVAFLAALFLSVAPLHVYYSQEARMYSLAAFAAALSFYFFIKAVNKDGKWLWFGLVVSNALVLYSDYVAYLIFPAQFLYLLREKQKIKKWLVAFLASLIFYLPWLLVLPKQISTGYQASIDLPFWKQAAGGVSLKNIALVFVKTIFGRISFDNKFIYGGLSAVAAIFYSWIVFLAIKKWNQRIKLLLVWLFGPLILAIIFSAFIPLLFYFRMIFILPAFYLLVGYGISSLPKMLFKVSVMTVIISSLIFLLIYYTNPKFQREDWRSVAKFLDQIPSDQVVIVFEDNHVKFPFIYYKKDLSNAFPGLKKVQAKSEKDVNDISSFLGNKKKIYLFEYLVEITDPQRLLEKKLMFLGFRQTNVHNFNGVGFVKLYESD